LAGYRNSDTCVVCHWLVARHFIAVRSQQLVPSIYMICEHAFFFLVERAGELHAVSLIDRKNCPTTNQFHGWVSFFFFLHEHNHLNNTCSPY